MKLEWEDVEDDNAGYMKRAEVPNGWLYRHDNDVPITVNEHGTLEWGHVWQTSICFVPMHPFMIEDIDH